MLKYVDTQVTFAEVPDEITLCVNISNCPHRCKGCHSPELWEDKGKILNWETLNALIYINKGISCVCLLGGDNDIKEINSLAFHIKKSTDLKVCWYTGSDTIPKELMLENFDYVKYGHYNEEAGPLNCATTNQVFIKQISPGIWKDITKVFWEKI